MKFLEEIHIVSIEGGKYTDKVKEIFGKILIGFNPTLGVALSVSEVFSGIFWTGSNNQKNGDLVLVVVPETTIESIRVGSGFDGVSHCTARINEEIITQALAIRKEKLILYICLTRNGREITAAGQLGL